MMDFAGDGYVPARGRPIPKPYVTHIGSKVAIIAVVALLGFAFPLLFLLAAYMAWNFVQHCRKPPDPAEDPEWYRSSVTPDVVHWEYFWWRQCESPAEDAFLEALFRTWKFEPRKGVLNNDVLRVELQKKIGRYRADALVNEKLVVEIDGAAYHTAPADVARDAERDRFMVSEGYTVLRIPAKVVFATPDVAISRVKNALASLTLLAESKPVATDAALPREPFNPSHKAPEEALASLTLSAKSEPDSTVAPSRSEPVQPSQQALYESLQITFAKAAANRATPVQQVPEPTPVARAVINMRVDLRLDAYREERTKLLGSVDEKLLQIRKAFIVAEEEAVFRQERAVLPPGPGHWPTVQSNRLAMDRLFAEQRDASTG